MVSVWVRTPAFSGFLFMLYMLFFFCVLPYYLSLFLADKPLYTRFCRQGVSGLSFYVIGHPWVSMVTELCGLAVDSY
jgi:hypothetical protein